MIETASIPSGGPEGFFRNAAGFISAHLAYLKARFQLAGLEGREAALHYALAAALGLGALVAMILGYLFMVLAAIFLIAWAIGGPHAWLWVTVGAAVLHFLGALGLAFAARAKLSQSVFAATLEEFKKDQAWLQTIVRQP